MQEKNITRRRLIISNSIYSIIMGMAIKTIMPVFTTAPIYTGIAMTLNAIGVGGLYYYVVTWSKFDLVFKNLKLGVGILYPILKSKKKGLYSTIYKFTLPPGLCVDDFKDKQIAIEEHLGKKINIEYLDKGLFIVEVFYSNKQEFFDYSPIELDGNVPILVGKDTKGKLISFDLGCGNEPHMLIAGGSGCGKSTSLRSIITDLILYSNVYLHLIDLKHGAEFAIFKNSSKVKSFATDLSEADTLLRSLTADIKRRYKLFADENLNDIHAYNKKHPTNKLPFEVLVIDEMIDFKGSKDLLKSLDVISAKARACGIHMILSTQRPDKDILEGAIKSNVTNILGMKTNNGVNSRIIIDDIGLENLKGKGHGLFLRMGTTTEVQTPYLDTDKAKDLIKHTYIDKTVKAKAEETIKVNIADLEVFN